MKQMLKLALPIALTQLGLMTMGLVDLLMVGRLGATAIGAVGLGNAIFSVCLIMQIGLLSGLDYFVAHAFGSKNHESAFRIWVQAIWVAIVMCVPLTALMIWLSFHLNLLRVNAAVIPEAGPFLRILALSLLPAVAFMACRQYLQAMEKVRGAMVLLVVSNLLNALFDYAFVFGHWGAPMLGSTGAAVATLLCRVWMMAVMFYLLWGWDRSHHRFFGRVSLALDRVRLRSLLNLGIPAALQVLFEVGVFAFATTLVSRLSAVELAAHQIALNIASLIFMIPLGISGAAAVMVGQAVGRGDPHEARQLGWRALRLSTMVMIVSCLTLLIFPMPILLAYTEDPQVIALGISLLGLVALFQLFDGSQIVATGALRGIGSTRSAAVANLIGHWLIGLPVGIYLTFVAHWGVKGIWVGLSVGLVLVAGTLVWRWAKLSQRKEIPSD